ncbi:hypothetical protein TeGR_g7763, partial [Tetraparma gracilis]
MLISLFTSTFPPNTLLLLPPSTRLALLSFLRRLFVPPLTEPFLNVARVSGLWSVLFSPAFAVAGEEQVEKALNSSSTLNSACLTYLHLNTLSFSFLSDLVSLSRSSLLQPSPSLAPSPPLSLLFSAELQHLLTLLFDEDRAPHAICGVCTCLSSLLDTNTSFTPSDKIRILTLLASIAQRQTHLHLSLPAPPPDPLTRSRFAALSLLSRLLETARSTPSESSPALLRALARLSISPAIGVSCKTKAAKSDSKSDMKLPRETYDEDEWGERMSARYSGRLSGGRISLSVNRSTTTSSSRTSSLADSFVPLFSPPPLTLCSCGRTECEAHLYLDVLITVFSRVFGKLKREFDKFLKPPPSPSTPSTPSLCSPLLSFISSTLSSLNHAQPSSFAFLRFFLVNRCNAPSLFNSFLQTIQQASAQQSSTTLQPLFNDLASTIATLYGQTLTVSLSQPVQPTALDSALYNSYLTTIPPFLLTSLKDTVFVLSSTLLPLSTIESLFALMNGAPPSSSSLTVHHPEVIPLIFSCFHKSNQLLQKTILDTFATLFSPSNPSPLTNKGMCCHSPLSPPLIDLVLDVFSSLPPPSQPSAAFILQALGTYYITVPQLKRIFRLMQVSDDNTRSPHLNTVLTSLSHMVEENYAPKRFFLLDGISSGFTLPSFPNSFTSKGYSFCASFKLSPSALSSRRPCLFSVSDDRSNSIALLLAQKRDGGGFVVTIETAGSRSPAAETTIFENLVVQPDIWYCMGLSHTPSTLMSTGRMWITLKEVRNTKNDASRSQQRPKQPYPNFQKSKTLSGSFGVRSHPPTPPSHCFRGEMGAVYFFQEGFSNDLLTRLCLSDFSAFQRTSHLQNVLLNPILSKLQVSCTPGTLQQTLPLPSIFSPSSSVSPSPSPSLPSRTLTSVTPSPNPNPSATVTPLRGTTSSLSLNFNDAL